MTIAQKVQQQFLEYLKKNNISKISIKNYRSDLGHFTSWVLISVRSWGASPNSLTESIPFLNQRLAENYRKHLLDSGLSRKTINRRLATLRHFGRFLAVSELLDYNFSESLVNVQKEHEPIPLSSNLVGDFRKHLEQEKVSKNTIKGYLSDVSQFLSWLNHQNLSK